MTEWILAHWDKLITLFVGGGIVYGAQRSEMKHLREQYLELNDKILEIEETCSRTQAACSSGLVGRIAALDEKIDRKLTRVDKIADDVSFLRGWVAKQGDR